MDVLADISRFEDLDRNSYLPERDFDSEEARLDMSSAPRSIAFPGDNIRRRSNTTSVAGAPLKVDTPLLNKYATITACDDINDSTIESFENEMFENRNSRRPRRLTQDSIQSTFRFQASNHRSQIFPITETPLSTRPVSLPLSRSVPAAHFPLHSLTTSTTTSVSSSELDSIDTKRPQGGSLDLGQRIDEGNVNFNIVRNMLNGIRSSCASVSESLDFDRSDKYIFDYDDRMIQTTGQDYAFKFKDYCGGVFKNLRRMLNINDNEYLDSLTSEYVLKELNSPGKSGRFLLSRDYKYIIKTIHHGEHLQLRRTLRQYYNYMKENPNSLLCQFYGLYRVKLPRTFQNRISNRKVYFIVMNNLLPPSVNIDVTFDLKGSLWGRYTESQGQEEQRDRQLIMKDINWIELHEKLNFNSTGQKNQFLSQLLRDVKLLAELNTMDYSLLVGFHYIENNPENDEPGSTKPVPRSPQENAFHGDKVVYYVGIIDCLTNYSLRKRLETVWRSLNHNLDEVSAIPPEKYATRFYDFISMSVETE
ncbi:uncharacterized protein KNAG_0A02560 [Huiozyma naganishii CBS 8797]|uniref:PIPK domain-containing protein n=1 Tax=Huiozyma naganishii (strain ATCC MYA-139 / BCRC 22969 / CBS 8797 / KCTC 17520 / NBRC 10181 / NCYC 3082 / Yp74L-3) TaxID=1071383 RepID=J7QZM5_HUIN7|nr:hypothetical protein KNAG_0A02560 [Kazachstania naganishii CBS 8797]CCK67945.1 hypothetical protein KNAG_0A02560 [Kazachstania naganishii CBS 8797]